MEHTKGIWKVDKYNNLITDNGNTLCVTGVAIPMKPTEESKANAKLIAAAPDQQAAGTLLYNLCRKLKGGLTPTDFAAIEYDYHRALNAHEQAMKRATDE